MILWATIVKEKWEIQFHFKYIQTCFHKYQRLDYGCKKCRSTIKICCLQIPGLHFQHIWRWKKMRVAYWANWFSYSLWLNAPIYCIYITFNSLQEFLKERESERTKTTTSPGCCASRHHLTLFTLLWKEIGGFLCFIVKR